MFHEFAYRHTPCVVNGQPDAVILSRGSSGGSQFGRESDYMGRFAPESPVVTGDIVITEDSYLICSLRITPDRDKYCGLVKSNVVIEVLRYSQKYDSNDNPIGDPTFNTVQSGVIAYAEFVNAKLLQENPGLLPTTAYLLRLQFTVDIKRPNDPALLQPDRVLLNGKPYRVDAIDDVKYPGLLQVQLSEDGLR
ncbi:hypothetical protein [Paenibacillus donghaensis]|uniref:Uncharacterized protein n=1 Tax=Paenibacillus donghaensis TaxID=414771 RepID=A0A2Z2KD71_9BACL|nr:hypothetical protein [Paenibacillus donghaensis]ASA20943.1 hypothetical protein B9T62_09190 [Paenibacillus donghaensis]